MHRHRTLVSFRPLSRHVHKPVGSARIAFGAIMSLSTESTEGESGSHAPAPGAPVSHSPLITGVSGDRCTHCNARLAIDQRYCVECGTRRGNPRFTLAPAPESVAAPSAVGQIGSAAVTRLQLLLALVMVLLAIAVGVLIGQGAAKTPRIVINGASVPRAGSAAKTGSGAPSAAGGATKSGSAGSGGSANSTPFTTGG
jgi:hypothetical protein